MQTVYMTGTVGTANHVFHTSKACARLYGPGESGAYEVRLLDGEPAGHIRADMCAAHVVGGNKLTAWGENYDTGGLDLVANHVTLRGAVAAIMGKPGYSYTGYRVGE